MSGTEHAHERTRNPWEPLVLAAVWTLWLVASTGAEAAEPWGNDPSHNMVRKARNLPVHFDDETLIWEIDTGSRHQFPMPTIVGDRILLGSDAQGNPKPLWSQAVRHGAAFTCYSLADGSEIWRLIVPEGGYGPGTYGVCGMPVVEGDRVYIMAMHEVFCLDLDGLADGNDGMQEELSLMTREPFKLPEGAEMPTELPAWAADVLWHFSLKPFNISVQDATSCTVIEVDGQIWVSTANQIGSRARSYAPGANKPHLVVLDKETGRLIARDQMDVPIVFHGEWSSPSLIEVNGEKAVIFGDGYGVLHAFGIPEPREDGRPVTLEKYWSFDVNPPEYRFLDDGREIVYTVDKRLQFKYPEGYYTDTDRYFMYTDGGRPGENPDAPIGFSWKNKAEADGEHETITGPSEIISMPVTVGNRIYVAIGRDRAYGLSRAPGRFVCLELDDVRQEPRLLWEDREIGRTQCSASVVDGLVYMADGQGTLNCYEADTGKVLYRFDLGAKSIKERSQIVADGKVYVCTDGRDMKVLKAGRTPALLAESKLRRAAGTIEAADGLILIATARGLMLYGRSADGSTRNTTTQWSDPANNHRNNYLGAAALPEVLTDQTRLWEVPITARWTFARPVAAGGRLFVGTTFGAVEDEQLKAGAGGKGGALLCFDHRTGQRLWELTTPDAYGWGYGVCSPVVVDGERVYVHSGMDLLCLDVKGQADGNDGPFVDEREYFLNRKWKGEIVGEPLQELKPGYGDIIWRFDIGGLGAQTHDGGSGTPLLDGRVVWVTTSHKMGLKPAPAWAEPEEDKDWKYRKAPNLIGLDAETGQLLARDDLEIPRVFHGQWSSVSMGTVNGQKLLFWGDGYGVLHAFARPERLKKGEVHILEEVWHYDANPREYRYDQNGEPIPFPRPKTRKRPGVPGVVVGPLHIFATPVFHQGRVYVATGRDRVYNAKEKGRVLGPGMISCVDAGAKGEIKPEDVIWRSREIGRTQCTPSIKDGLLYIADMQGYLRCFDAETGQLLWKEDLGAMVLERSQMLADGKLYVSTRKNEFFVFRAGREPELLWKSRLRSMAATPTAVDGIVFLCTQRKVAAYAGSEKVTAAPAPSETR